MTRQGSVTEDQHTCKLRGVIVPILTPLVDDNTVDETAFRSLLRRCMRGGVHGIFVGGTAGLGPLLTDIVVARMFEIARDEVKDGPPLLAGVIETSTPRAVGRIRQLESMGYRRFVITPTFYLSARNSAEFMAHFGACREATDMEMVLYNIPACTASCIPVAAVIEMANRKWITAIKDSSGDLDYFDALCRQGNPRGLGVFQGLRPDLQRLLQLGAAGVVPVPANLDPATFVTAWHAAGGSDTRLLAALQARVDVLWDALVIDSDFISRTVFALSQLGVGTGHLLTPLGAVSQADQQAIRALLRTLN